MSDISIYDLFALWLSVVFSLIGTVQLIGPRFVREAYQRWNYGRRVRLVTGALDIVAAVMLGVPPARAWGIALAALLTFGSVVVFLNHRQYRQAIPAIALLLALIPATAAVPRQAPIQFIDARESPLSGSLTVVASDERAASGSIVLD